jgi:oligoendopeptidase F
MKEAVEALKRPARKFLPEEFVLTSWGELKPYFEDLLSRPLASAQELKKWFSDRSELESVISEDLAWRYIRMTCYTENQEYLKSYQDFIQNIQPEIAPVSDKLNKKAAASEFLDALAGVEGYKILIRNLRKEIEIFREENVP